MLLTRTLKKLSADFQVMMADQSISADTALAEFQNAFANSFVNSNEGRRFSDVHRALYERNANTEMHDAFDDELYPKSWTKFNSTNLQWLAPEIL